VAKRERIEEARRLLGAPGKGGKTDVLALAERRRREKEQAEKREARQAIRALEKELAEAGSRLAFVDALLEAPAPRPFKVWKKRKEGKRLPAAAYVMCASDWHMGERVRPETIGYRNEYSPSIAQERARQFFESQLQMLKGARASWEINQGVLWLGGDLMTGYIHEEYQEENFLSPVEEALLIHETLTAGIQYLLDESDFEHLLVPANYGNHGRTGQKLKVSSGAKNSFEWLAYQHLARRFENEPRVTFQVAAGYHQAVDLYGFRISFHHGDAITYQGGIGGVTIPANKRIQRIQSTLPPRFELTDQGPTHLDVFGHHHELMYPRLFVQNGSLIGWNAYAERLGCAYQDPLQCSFVVDERYKVVSNFNPILVTPRRRGKG